MAGANAHVRAAGEALNEAKSRLEHGEWGDWLTKNFKASAVTARWYMKVASKWPEIEAAKLQDASLEVIRAHLAGPSKGRKDKKDEGEDEDGMEIKLPVTVELFREFNRHMEQLNDPLVEKTGVTVCRIVREAYDKHQKGQQP